MGKIEFEKNIKVSGKIVLETGLHIGAAAEAMKIGGTDSPVVMDYLKRVPIIPGSSLKGKMRSLIELSEGNYNTDGEVHSCDDPSCKLCLIFGRSAEDSEKVKLGPTRLIVRDCFPDDETKKRWEETEDIINGTEIKMENWINRITSGATPRTFERVPAGSKFNFEMILSVYSGDDEKENLRYVLNAMGMLEDNYLGGLGSRGYGKISFEIEKIEERRKEDYINGNGWKSYDNIRFDGAKKVNEVLQLLK